MTKNAKAVAVVIGVGVALYVTYRLAFAKQIFATSIVKSGKATNYKTLMTFDVAYLKDWAKAIKEGAEQFIHKGKTYKTEGGKAV